MSSPEIKEQQIEEHEALISIYDGDNAFKAISPTTFQYRYGEETDNHTFLLELAWGENYPNELPNINLDVFYNRHLLEIVKNKITDAVKKEGEQWLGCGMTYTLFECLKDHIEELMEDQTTSNDTNVENEDDDDDDDDESDDSDSDDSSDADKPSTTKKPAKKEQLSKAQKRRQWDQSATGGERPRGWDWVDIVKHLAQVGNKDEQGSIPQNYDG